MVMVCMYEQRSAGEPQAFNVMQQIKVLQTGAFFDGWLSLFFLKRCQSAVALTPEYLTTGLNKWHARRGPDFAFHFTWVLLTLDGTLGQSVYQISDFQSIMTNQYQRDLEYK